MTEINIAYAPITPGYDCEQEGQQLILTDQYDECGTIHIIVGSDADLPDEAILQHLKEQGHHFTNYCHHSHDCCGCISYGKPEITKLPRGHKWCVSVSWSRNV